jgi:acetyltransferase-like isoleucine patch superfamily enzyme
MIKTIAHGAIISIGHDVGVSGCTISAGRSIVIGNRVLVGSGAIITDSDAHPIDPVERMNGGVGARKNVIIEDDVFIGARAIILKGVTIGKGSVIGAGAVVAKNIPPYSVAVGNPVKVVGDSRRIKSCIS